MEDRLAGGVDRRGAVALAALAGILVVTVAWWALALWPGDAATPAWVERTRAACFGAAPGGLPHAGGWILLVGEPIGMVAFLLVAWGDAVRAGVRALRRSLAGQATMAAVGLTLVVGLGGVAMRVRDASAAPFDVNGGATPEAQRVDRASPPLVLPNQHGDTIALADFRGRPVVVAFAYGHCATVCPLIVQDAKRALREAPASNAVLLVVTLDPWRDTPDRLPHIARGWGLPEGAHLLGGSVAAVEAALDAWGVARARDTSTGEIAHATGVSIVDPAGRLAWIAPGAGDAVARILRGM